MLPSFRDVSSEEVGAEPLRDELRGEPRMTWARSDAALGIAARSVLASRRAGSTVESVVADRALEHQWHSLSQYAFRHAGPTVARRLLAELTMKAEDDELVLELSAPPGARARLFARLRETILACPDAEPLPDDSPLYLARDGATVTRALVALRRGLGDLAETAELVHTRGLRPAEAAFVLGVETAEIDDRIARAQARAAEILGGRPPGRTATTRGAMIEAFALDESLAPAPTRRARPPLLEAGMIVGTRYEIEDRLGAGAFAEVYRARDLEVSDHVVALKMLRVQADDDDDVASALRELQLIASVFHPSIVQLKDHGWHDRRLWFVMPLYRGETLAQRLRRGPLARAEARRIFEPIARALAAMHRVGVRHQDVKPENVFLAQLDAQGDASPVLPILLDLGVAARDAELVLAGTPSYFAPEVAARFASDPDPPPVGPKSDVFSLALTLRDALDPSEIEPLVGGSVDAFVALRSGAAPRPPQRKDLRYLSRAFERWLAVSPDARPTAEQLARELALLTAPEERRARRIAVVRWAAPLLVGSLALFGSVAYVLQTEADVQRLEAERARALAETQRLRAETVSASLSEEEARVRALRRDVSRLEEQYESSRLTREELALRLAQSETSAIDLQRRNDEALARIASVTTALEQQRTLVASLEHEAEDRQRELAIEHVRRERSESRLDELSAELESTREQTRIANARLTELERDLRQARASILVSALYPPRPGAPPRATSTTETRTTNTGRDDTPNTDGTPGD